MKISQLRQIIEVLSCGSINKASENLYISQSGLSASILSAEKELGRPLVQRSHSGIIPTEFGMHFWQSAQKILTIYDELIQEPPLSEESLCISSQFLRYAGSAFVMICSKVQNPHTKLSFTEKSNTAVLYDILEGRSDLGIVVTPSTSRNRIFDALNNLKLDGHLIRSDQGRCMIGRSHPLYDSIETSISLHDLARYPRLLYFQNDWPYTKGLFEQEERFFPSNGVITISDTGSFQNFLSQTNAYFIGIHPDAAYRVTDFYNDIRVLSIVNCSFMFDTIWIQRNGYELTQLDKEYLHLLYTIAGSSSTPAII